MPITESSYIWMNGELIDWKDAKVHVLTHGLHYGTGVFEGIRAYDTSDGPAIFRLTEHIKRFHDSARMIMLEIPFSVDELVSACKSMVRENGLGACYVRPVAFTSYGEMGISPASSALDVAIGAWPWGSYLGDEGVSNGVRMKISGWQRTSPNTVPPAAKVTGAYVNSALAKMEAVKAGYDEAILLSAQGYVSECTGENLFAVKDGKIITPPTSAGALAGITRSTIREFARELGVEFVEANLVRSDLFLADELFLTGTAAEVVPIVSVDDRQIANGKPGELTKTLQERYYAAVSGRDTRHPEWLEHVKA